MKKWKWKQKQEPNSFWFVNVQATIYGIMNYAELEGNTFTHKQTNTTENTSFETLKSISREKQQHKIKFN